MLKAIIVDDEARSRKLLQTLIEEYCEEIEIIAVADDVPSAVQVIRQKRPDLVFLDIEMPGYTGFQLLDFFEEIDFEIIFATAYREYAIQAFEVSAIDYLLKPIQIDQLLRAVEKVKKQVHQAFQQQRIWALQENLKQDGLVSKIALPVSDGLFFVEVSDILYLSAERSYCNVHLIDGNRMLVSRNLKELERLLPHPFFFRSHRSYLINLNYIEQLVRKDGGYITMSNGDVVSLSRARRDLMLEKIKAI